MPTILTQSFYNRPTLQVAEDLLGKFLVIEKNKLQTPLMITEVEAYDGPTDRASHAYKGKTPRTKIMFGPAGYWYVYLIYGVYWMLNIVTGEENYPAAILIRAAGGYNGPGKLTKTWCIDKNFNEKIALPQTGLWIEDRMKLAAMKIKKTPRIGVAYAGAEWAMKPYRFMLESL